jgi:hypothetical protein
MSGSCFTFPAPRRVDGRDKRGHDAARDASRTWMEPWRGSAALDTSAGPIDVAERIVRHIER